MVSSPFFGRKTSSSSSSFIGEREREKRDCAARGQQTSREKEKERKSHCCELARRFDFVFFEEVATTGTAAARVVVGVLIQVEFLCGACSEGRLGTFSNVFSSWAERRLKRRRRRRAAAAPRRSSLSSAVQGLGKARSARTSSATTNSRTYRRAIYCART